MKGASRYQLIIEDFRIAESYKVFFNFIQLNDQLIIFSQWISISSFQRSTTKSRNYMNEQNQNQFQKK